MTDHRTDPPVSADEVDTLRGFLDFHRETLRWKTSGLDADELAHRIRPSSMTLGGLLKHLAFVESQSRRPTRSSTTRSPTAAWTG